MNHATEKLVSALRALSDNERECKRLIRAFKKLPEGQRMFRQKLWWGESRGFFWAFQAHPADFVGVGFNSDQEPDIGLADSISAHADWLESEPET